MVRGDDKGDEEVMEGHASVDKKKSEGRGNCYADYGGNSYPPHLLCRYSPYSG